ncbi:MAG TPA: cation transporter [Terriglobales bacterium]|nr:cation transporter [Terriglobales bacterium]
METLTLAIAGMSCSHCVAAVEKALAALPGVAAASVAVGSARIEFDPERVRPERIAAAIRAAGYEPRPE